MISLATAKKLKNSGLKWEPTFGDCYVYVNELGPTPTKLVRVLNFGSAYPEQVWLPHLDQLLSEIERRGYDYGISCTNGYIERYYLNVKHKDLGSEKNYWHGFTAAAIDEAAAQALLWILGRSS